jgi:hypothetical protein
MPEADLRCRYRSWSIHSTSVPCGETIPIMRSTYEEYTAISFAPSFSCFGLLSAYCQLSSNGWAGLRHLPSRQYAVGLGSFDFLHLWGAIRGDKCLVAQSAPLPFGLRLCNTVPRWWSRSSPARASRRRLRCHVRRGREHDLVRAIKIVTASHERQILSSRSSCAHVYQIILADR